MAEAFGVTIQKRGFLDEGIRDTVNGKGAFFINGQLPGFIRPHGAKTRHRIAQDIKPQGGL